MNCEISKMTEDDILSIQDNFQKNFDEFWTISILKDDLNSENSKYIVAKFDNEIVGIAGIKIIFENAEIMNIVIRKDKRSLGIGSALLSQLIKIAELSNCTSVLLEVNENNFPALQLYSKFSFQRIGFRKKYYNNTDNAILMKKDIKTI